MDISNRIFGGCIRYDERADKNVLLPATLAINLLLFDSFVMVSVLLAEFPQIIQQFGFDETLELLKTDALEIHCEPTQIVNMGSTEESLRKGTAFSYQIQVLVSQNHREYISSCFDDLHKNIPLPDKKIIKLKEAILKRLDLRVQKEERLNSPEFKAARSLTSDLEANVPSVKRSVILQLERKGKKGVTPEDFELLLHRHEGDKFDAETNIVSALGITEHDGHDAVLQGILNLGGIKQTFQYMSHYSAISSLNEAETSILADELDFFARQMSPERKIEQFTRVLNLKGLPDLELTAMRGELKLDKILELRETREIKEFRTWLLNLDSATDAEIKEQIEGISNHIGTFLPTEGGKTIRLLTTTLIGAIPVVGPVAGVGASFVDSFWLEKIYPQSGPLSFVNNQLPSIFPADKSKDSGLTILDL